MTLPHFCCSRKVYHCVGQLAAATPFLSNSEIVAVAHSHGRLSRQGLSRNGEILCIYVTFHWMGEETAPVWRTDRTFLKRHGPWIMLLCPRMRITEEPFMHYKIWWWKKAYLFKPAPGKFSWRKNGEPLFKTSSTQTVYRAVRGIARRKNTKRQTTKTVSLWQKKE